jgi:predicted ATP-grasp superfamily ATP-dependent carboligase
MLARASRRIRRRNSGEKRGRFEDLAPALLTTPEYYGTLAAVRRLGRAGIRVAVAHSTRLGVAAFSRYAAERRGCPPSTDSDRFVDWLSAYGEERGQHALCATSDDTVWLFARHRKRLAEHYALSSNSVEAIYSLLNKKRLNEICAQVGIDTPDTWLPESDAELARLARELRFPVMVKPVTQILFENRWKGMIARNASELVSRYQRLAKQRYARAIREFDPLVQRPLVQQYFREAADAIYSLSGFIDESGDSLAVRASVKVLQHPRQLGVGLCFEHAPVKWDLVEKVAELCRLVGYSGVFEVEFIQAGGRFLLIDFNPRFYNQMGFDLERGLDVVLLSYYSALGERARVRELLQSSALELEYGPSAHLHRFNFEVTLRAQRLSGVLEADDEQSWRRWRAAHGQRCTDAAFDRADWFPAILDGINSVYGYLKHPRAFVRTVVLNR